MTTEERQVGLTMLAKYWASYFPFSQALTYIIIRLTFVCLFVKKARLVFFFPSDTWLHAQCVLISSITTLLIQCCMQQQAPN